MPCDEIHIYLYSVSFLQVVMIMTDSKNIGWSILLADSYILSLWVDPFTVMDVQCFPGDALVWDYSFLEMTDCHSCKAGDPASSQESHCIFLFGERFGELECKASLAVCLPSPLLRLDIHAHSDQMDPCPQHIHTGFLLAPHTCQVLHLPCTPLFFISADTLLTTNVELPAFEYLTVWRNFPDKYSLPCHLHLGQTVPGMPSACHCLLLVPANR